MQVLVFGWFVFFSFWIGDLRAHGEVPEDDQDRTFNFDFKKSYVSWNGYEIEGKKVGKHFGKLFLKDATMTLLYPKGKGPVAKGEFLIDMNSIVCDDLKSKALNKKLIEHLKSQDFLSVNKFPFAKFDIQGIDFSKDKKGTDKNKEERKFEGYTVTKTGILKGKFEFLGKTKDINIPITLLVDSKDVKSKSGRSQFKILGDFQINRRDFGMDFMSSSSNKDKYIKDTVDIAFNFDTLGVKNN